MLLRTKFFIKRFVKEGSKTWHFLKKIYKRTNSLKRITFGELPDFIVVGAQKAGTSALFNYLIQHPSIIEPSAKEIHFFDRDYKKGIKYYKRSFPTRTYKNIIKKLTGNAITGEATPDYCYIPNCMERINYYIPNVKIIFIIRNPIERAYSEYIMNIKKGIEKLSFEEALEKEEERIKCLKKPPEEVPIKEGFSASQYSYKDRGIYITQLKRIEKLFPKNNILLINHEDMKKDTMGELTRVLKFLGIRDKDRFYNPQIKPKKKEMNTNTRKNLQKFFKKYNEELYEHIGKDLGWK